MAYKISGTVNDSARIIVINEADWSVESYDVNAPTSFEALSLSSGTKTVIARANSGEVLAVGDVSSVYYSALGDRGIFAGESSTTLYLNVIEYITISTTGNSTDFGDLIYSAKNIAGSSNGGLDRGLFGGGGTTYPTVVNNINYITISVLSNASDFGDLSTSRRDLAATSNGTNDRGVFAGGRSVADTPLATIDYVTVSTTGNALSFGNLASARSQPAGTSNAANNRGVFAGGTSQYYMDYINIASTGNAIYFGELTVSKIDTAGCSNGVNDRGVWGGGSTGSNSDVIDHITISSASNASDFGDLTIGRYNLAASSNGVAGRGTFAGGYSTTAVIDYITIATTGNATVFGNLTASKQGVAGTSNA